jgi:dihydroneopterin aldolase
MKAEIAVEGMECYAFHGCLPEEAITGGQFVIDAYFETDISGAVSTDELSKTIDYVRVNAIVQREMKQRSKLIEHVAGRILASLRQEFKTCHSIRVRVTKLNPPSGFPLRQASVTVVDNSP